MGGGGVGIVQEEEEEVVQGQDGIGVGGLRTASASLGMMLGDVKEEEIHPSDTESDGVVMAEPSAQWLQLVDPISRIASRVVEDADNLEDDRKVVLPEVHSPIKGCVETFPAANSGVEPTNPVVNSLVDDIYVRDPRQDARPTYSAATRSHLSCPLSTYSRHVLVEDTRQFGSKDSARMSRWKEEQKGTFSRGRCHHSPVGPRHGVNVLDEPSHYYGVREPAASSRWYVGNGGGEVQELNLVPDLAPPVVVLVPGMHWDPADRQDWEERATGRRIRRRMMSEATMTTTVKSPRQKLKKSPMSTKPAKKKKSPKAKKDPADTKPCAWCGKSGDHTKISKKCAMYPQYLAQVKAGYKPYPGRTLTDGEMAAVQDSGPKEVFTMKMKLLTFLRKDNDGDEATQLFRRRFRAYLCTQNRDVIPDANMIRLLCQGISPLDVGGNASSSVERQPSVAAIDDLFELRVPNRRDRSSVFIGRFKRLIVLLIEHSEVEMSRKRKGAVGNAILSQFVWEEARAYAQVNNQDFQAPRMPLYVRPYNVFTVAGNINDMTAEQKDFVNHEVLHVIDQVERGAALPEDAQGVVLPLCRTNFGTGKFDDKRWRRYYYAHAYIVERTESLLEHRRPHPDLSPQPTNVTQGACWKAFTSKAKELDLALSMTATKKIVGAVRALIKLRQPEKFQNFRHKMLTENRGLLEAGTYDPDPKKLFEARGLGRGHALLPLHGFRAQYLQVDTTNLIEMLSDLLYKENLPWPNFGDVVDVDLQAPAAQEEVRPRNAHQFETRVNRKNLWPFLFRPDKIIGLQPWRVDGVPGRDTKRVFRQSIMTNGVGVSLICERPRGQKQPGLTAAGATFRESTQFVAIDPGLRSVMTGVRFPIVDPTGHEWANTAGADLMEREPVEADRIYLSSRANEIEKFKITSGYWHHEAFHNRAQEDRKQLDQTFDRQNPQKLQDLRNLPVGKTVRSGNIGSYILEHLKRFTILYNHQTTYRKTNFEVFRHTARAFNDVCKQVVGDATDVVVAYGAGGFGATLQMTRSGRRAIPVAGLRKALKCFKGVQLVLVDEFRTSKVCSRCWVVEEDNEKIWMKVILWKEDERAIGVEEDEREEDASVVGLHEVGARAEGAADVSTE
ncbi:hypothetical protein HK101_007299 [Irineochytrium annulatum]|nr:hypothetical protein HK101_007299 [Irineochytrium annulatum]